MISFSENKNDCKSEDSTTSAYGVIRGFANKDTLINNNNNNTLRKREKTEREQSKRG